MYILGEVHYELLRVTSMCAVVPQQLTVFVGALVFVCLLPRSPSAPVPSPPRCSNVREAHQSKAAKSPDCLYLCSPALLVQSMKPKPSLG